MTLSAIWMTMDKHLSENEKRATWWPKQMAGACSSSWARTHFLWSPVSSSLISLVCCSFCCAGQRQIRQTRVNPIKEVSVSCSNHRIHGHTLAHSYKSLPSLHGILFFLCLCSLCLPTSFSDFGLVHLSVCLPENLLDLFGHHFLPVIPKTGISHWTLKGGVKNWSF